jgi:LuxR family maltose regulon positive regulatory protein
VLRLKGKYTEALHLCNDLLQTINASTTLEGYRIGLLSSILYSIVGYILAEQGRLEEGIQNALKGYDLSRGVLSLSFHAYSGLLLAETYYKAGEFRKALKLIEELEKIINKNIAQWLYVLSKALKCKLFILLKEDEKADFILSIKEETGKDHAFESLFYGLAMARNKLAQQQIDEALQALHPLVNELEKKDAFELLAEAELLKAKAFLSRNDKEEALDAVIKSLGYTQNENLVRTYINEGEEIESLLKEIQQRKKVKSSKLMDAVSREYLDVLIRTFEKEKRITTILSADALSTRELDILKLIAEDLTNQEIANALYISLATVKTHVRNILLKLEVKNRSEAVSKAREKLII